MRALKVYYSDVGEGGVAVNCEKNHNFSLTPCTLQSNIIVNFCFRELSQNVEKERVSHDWSGENGGGNLPWQKVMTFSDYYFSSF